MEEFELTNEQRQYFGLQLVCEDWHKQPMNNAIAFYFNKDKIVKIINKSAGYFEYDTDIDTRDRTILIPRTKRGKELNLTIPRVLHIKGAGVQFSGSFQGGGIRVYDNRRNLFFIKSYPEEGEIRSYTDIDNWISKYIANAPSNYFNWLKAELSQKLSKIKVSEGDIIAFKITRDEYGFARILMDVYAAFKNGKLANTDGPWAHLRSLMVAPYAFYSNTTEIDLDNLITKGTLPALNIFDVEVYRGEMPVIGHRPLTEKDRLITFPKRSTFLTIPYTKSDIENYMSDHMAN